MRIYVGKKTNRPWRWIVLVGCILLCLVLVIAALWPLLCRLIPPKKHAGVELYESGEYLQYEKGEVFREQIAKLPFVADAQVLSFEYYDFWFRDAIFRDDPFADAFILELDLGEHYASALVELETKGAWNHSTMQDYPVYEVGESGNGDYLFVIMYEDSQKAVCLLITDTDSWISALGIWHMNFTIPEA